MEGDYEVSGHEVIKLAPDIESQVASVLLDKDPLDSGEFDPVTYINALFPNEQSLSTVDTVLTKLRTKIRGLDQEIRELVRSQTDAGGQIRGELEATKKAMQDLFTRIKLIKEKAKQSEMMVHEITKDIKSLDHAKRNLAVSITVLKRLQMLVSALDQLRVMGSRKQYTEVAQILQVAVQLLQHFRPYKSVRQISVLCEAATNIQADLRRQIFNDFDAGFVGGNLRSQVKLLSDASLVIEVLEGDAKRQLIDWYTDLQLKDYRNIFRNNLDVGGLDNVSRRYAWLKRILKTYDDEHSQIFSSSWGVAESLCDKFCSDTKKDLEAVLVKLGATVDTKIMLQALQQTIDFESKLGMRFGSRVGDEVGSPKGDHDVAPQNGKFSKAISAAFESSLVYYIESEDKVLGGMMDSYRIKPEEEEGIYSSSTDLFYFYRQSLVQCAKLSTRKPFLEMCKLFGKWLRAYADILQVKLPRDDGRSRNVTDDELRTISFVINTADYCTSTTSQLEEKLQEKIDLEFKEQVNFDKERESFLNVTSNGVKALVRAMELVYEGPLNSASKMSWSAVESVGDQSKFVSQMATALGPSASIIKKTLTNHKYYRTFCDKFSESILSKWHNVIYKCKPISEIGAEQMLLDTQGLRGILIEMANIGSDPTHQAPATYIKILSKGVTKIEQLLKVVMSPHEPPEGLVQNYILLFNDPSVANFSKVLDLKGLKRADQQAVIEVFQNRAASGIATPSLSTPASTISASAAAASNAATSSANSASAASAASQTKAQQQFSQFTKFVSGMGKTRNP
ncbi:hypothetical protein SmJEL517_g05106 [Synchytrium microbalum]|uniref:Uncharacterized protein n=1 Tax=Synchytrium microbalum TaxID=1806994 RepID=A0A507BWY7_9FUNG|nr:uncharacterized protein SmJEL517_g05106 [Synchytrium microbalum]TPX31611.1 hypothetical protein SmJEL517_g05106 [Synchytrium microbalum]